MDAKTPAGREALAHVERALRSIEAAGAARFIRFSDDLPAVVDGLMLDRNGIPIALYEAKARSVTLEHFRGAFQSEWLLSYDKMVRAAPICRELRLGFAGVLVLHGDNVALVKMVWDVDQRLLVPIRIEQTETRATVNGGTASRANAFIPMEKARIFTIGG